MKYLLTMFIAILAIVQFSYSFKTHNTLQNGQKILKDIKNSTDIDKEAFFPQGRVKSFSFNMAKYFTRFAKLAYCNLNIFIKNPLCEKIRGEWRTMLATRYIKVLKSAKGLIKKKVIFSCATPKKLFKLQEDRLVYNETERQHFNTTFGEYEFFNKFYKQMIRNGAEYELIHKLFHYLKMDKFGLTQVFFIGHSYGGVICNMLALKAAKHKNFDKFKGKDSPVLITYGAPNIGGEKFAKLTDSKIPLVYRVISDTDALPTYPRTIEEDQKIKNEEINKKLINNIGKHIVMNFKTGKYEFCNFKSKSTKSKKNKDKSPKKCEISTNYMSYNNRFYFKDNIAGISPKSEFNKAWDNAAAISNTAYKGTK